MTSTHPDRAGDGLSEAIERAEDGTALYVWRVDADSPWRITDWEGISRPDGIPDSLESVRDCGRVDLYGPRGVAAAIRAFPTQKDSGDG